jgi:hypothetical protein
MRGGLLAPAPEPSQEVALVVVLEGRDVPIGEGDSHPPSPLETSPPGFLPGSSVQETDLDAATDIVTPHSWKRFASSARRGSMRGAVLSHPGTGGADDIRLLPTSAVVRGTFTMRGELLHCFISYRVATEGMVLTLHQSSAKTCNLLHSRPWRPPAVHPAPLIPHALMAQGPVETGSPSTSPRRSGKCRRTPTTATCTSRSTVRASGQRG